MDHLLCGVSQMATRLSFSGLYFVFCRLLRYWCPSSHQQPATLSTAVLFPLSMSSMHWPDSHMETSKQVKQDIRQISRRRQRDPNYCNALTRAVIPSLSSQGKKADSPEPKRMFPAVLELQQRCGCVCLQLNNTPEDSFVFNTTKYQHNQCFSPLALWNSFKVCSASQISSVVSCSEPALWKNKSQNYWYSVLLFFFFFFFSDLNTLKV